MPRGILQIAKRVGGPLLAELATAAEATKRGQDLEIEQVGNVELPGGREASVELIRSLAEQGPEES